MKRILILLFTIAGIITSTAQTAQDVLDKVLGALNSAPAIEADYIMSSPDGSTTGKIILAGEKFKIKGDGVAIWFDSKTQWSYSQSTAEVNVTEPTHDELAEINPLIILNSEPEVYAIKLKKKTKSDYQLELVDRSGGDMNIARALIYISTHGYLPTRAAIETASGEKCELTFSNVKKLETVNSSIFYFNPKEYPGVEIIDLR